MEMPFHLKTLPTEALSILRYYSQSLGSGTADSEAIMGGANLSERGFSKGIKRLVTKGYMLMDGTRSYSLTDQGRRAVADLLEYDAEALLNPQEAGSSGTREVQRRLVMAAPRRPQAGQPVNVFVGFHDADDDGVLDEPLNLVIRLSVVNGEPARPKESPFTLDNRAARQVFEVTPGQYARVRLRVQVYQAEDIDEVTPAGGMYVDLDVTPDAVQADTALAAYGTYASFTASS
jgi:predicted transcriptional regulator